MKDKFLSIILLLFIGHCSFAEEPNRTSLFFYSHEVIKDRRTSLNLTPDGSFGLGRGFSIEFNACFRQGDGYYGFVSRVIADRETNVDLISNLAASSANFALVVKDNEVFSFDFDEIPGFAFGEWIAVKLEINPGKSLVALSFNGVRKEKSVAVMRDFKKFDIVFGAYDNPKFQNTDVSPMTLSDVRIWYEGKVFRHWKLSKHAVDAVYDEVVGARASVRNGSWLIDKHLTWEEQSVPQLSTVRGIVKNEQDGIVYVIGESSMLLYRVESGEADSVVYRGGVPFNNNYDCFVYNPFTKRIVSYDLTTRQTNEFDFATRMWQRSDFTFREPDFSHHNKVYSPVDSSLVIFGGYGHYRYKAIVSVNGRETDYSTKIYPRYLSAAGLWGDDKWLIFGGYGSKSGKQEISPEFFYDLYAYDLKSHALDKIRDYPAPENPFVPCEALITSEDGGSFYVLLYNTGNFNTSLRLAKFGIDTDELVVFPDSLPYNFADIASWCTMFRYKQTLVAVTSHKSDVRVYTLAYPPLLTTDVIQTAPEKQSGWLPALFLSIVVAAAAGFALRRYAKRAPEAAWAASATDEEGGDDEQLRFEILKLKSKSSIYFLGGFQVYDSEGNDISVLFSPIIRQLFIIILLYMVKNGRGASTLKLSETLWYDKTGSSARNNRNVTISKLRALLDKVGKMDVVLEGAYWHLRMESVYIDYVEVMAICERLKEKNVVVSEAEALHFVQIVSKGEMLPNMRVDWVDDFKAEFSNLVIDTLLKIAALPNITPNNRLITHAADAIFKFDSINEDAIALKCTALCRLGKKGLAKTVYESFTKEYYALLGATFDVPFNKLVS